MFKLLQNLKIGPRLAIGFGSLLTFMLAIVAIGLIGFYVGSRDLDALVGSDYRKLELADSLVREFNENGRVSTELALATDPEERVKLAAAIRERRGKVQALMDELGERVGSTEGKALYDKIVEARKLYVASADKLFRLVETNKRDEAISLMEIERLPALKNLTQATNDLSVHQQWRIKDTADRAKSKFDDARTNIIVLGLIAAALGALLAYFIARHIVRATSRLQDTVQRVAAGDYAARVQLTTGDELGNLGRAFDTMLNERVASLAQKEKENEALNTSIIDLLRSVAKLSRGDLTTKAPVREDITGALADAINSMADSTAKTLGGVNVVSREVRSASQNGRDTVLSTAKGMNEIRGSIQETGKRIKRLGERSQEITGIVKLIDDIAERTSVLALNANMQAAMAGEAGRGFRVVADEVQRLAERSKEATDQIAKLVTNIQAETNDTIATMDRAIGEVVKGGELAEQAARQVSHLDELGEQLISSVQTFTLPQEYVAAEGASGNRRAA